MSDSVRPHRRQPSRLPRPWDSPGKNTGVGCHCLLQCMKVKSESEVAPSCPHGLRLPGSSAPGIFQARVPEWGAIAFSRKLKYRHRYIRQWGFLGGSMVKKPPATTGDEVNMVQSLGEEDSLSRKCQPTPVFLPGKFHGLRSLVGCSPWSHQRIGHD